MITTRFNQSPQSTALRALGLAAILATPGFVHGADPPPRDRSRVGDEEKKWWAFQPLARNAPPPARGGSATMNPIDRFILAKAATNGLSLSIAADRRTLIRRANLDLLGLPPAPEEVRAFVEDRSPEAWPRLIDRLLASPQHGERWARHWLDVARFAESSGFEHDYDREGAFHYRDFVIKALNMDLPFDQFVRWQVAGDEFEPDNPLALTATGFLGAGVFPTQITANEVERTRYDAMDDMLSTTSVAFLGLTVGCARCHDHKFDPIPSRDYYRMLATFSTTVRSVIDLDLDPDKTRVLTQQWEAGRVPLTEELDRHEGTLKPQFGQWLANGAALPAGATWTILDPTRVESKAGATFKKLDDGSWLVEGKNGDHDEYTFIAATTLRGITGLRLEALAHPSMKKGGPGRADNGNIGLSRLRLFAAPAAGGATQEVKLVRAEADFEQNKETLSVASALDDKPGTGWAVDPQFGKDHTAVFTFAEPLDFTNDVVLTVKLEFRLNTKHNIGRPRLSVFTGPEPSLQGEVLPARIAQLLQVQFGVAASRESAANPLPPGQDQKSAALSRVAATPNRSADLSDADRAALFDWWKRRDSGWRERTVRVEEHARKKPDGRSKVLVCAEGHPPLRMHTQGADFFEQTHFLKRGSTDQKDGVASPGFLQALMPVPGVVDRWQWTPPEGAKFSGRRRALANWMTDTNAGAGALLARVAVNRLWQHHFGRGLVATPNDFGHTGAPPTHPELLDWLAAELIRGGWKLKPIHRLLMTSATYRQSGAPDRAKESADPANQLFLRRVPRRLEGEAIRDCILAVSGVLDPAMFGKGTKDERSRRRSIYFTVKRSQLIGSMVAFDQPEPLVSQGLRPVTTVAPQALFLLNGPQVREWAGAFAQRLEPGGPVPARVRRAYQFALGRDPAADEARDAAQFIEAQTRSYVADGKTDAPALALTDVCQVLFGLNEFAYEP